jgi:hypothetical protein
MRKGRNVLVAAVGAITSVFVTEALKARSVVKARLWGPTALFVVALAGGLLAVLTFTPSGAPAAYQSHIQIKGKKQGQFSSTGTKKPSTAPTQVSPRSSPTNRR